jgi:hypothetical protein
METIYKNCQSCSMPMSRDDKGGGTNADGSKSTMYCSHCWHSGRFTLPDIGVEQMQQLVRAKLREFGVPAPLGWFFARKVPKLARWTGGARAS